MDRIQRVNLDHGAAASTSITNARVDNTQIDIGEQVNPAQKPIEFLGSSTATPPNLASITEVKDQEEGSIYTYFISLLIFQ